MVIRKILQISIPAAAGVLVALQWPEIRRFVKLKQMSMGQGHPNVPMWGTQANPTHPGDSEQDGTGDFDSASRGGPAGAP
jgi:hypothetical protein